MKKKTAIIIERADIVLGGAERSVFELSLALSGRGFDVEILAAKGQSSAKNTHILCKNTAGKRVCYFTFAKELKKFLSQNHYDIIHSVLPFEFADIYQPRGGCYAESILRNAASYENSFVESYKRLTAFANIRRTILLRAEKRLCKNVNGPIIAALSEYVSRQFREHYGVDEHRLVVIPNGVKVDKTVDVNEAGRLRGQILAQLKLKEAANPILFLFVANNFRLKGLSCLINAMKLMSANRSERPICLIAAGHGKTRRYRHLAKKLGVSKRIVFLGSIRHIQNVLSIADAAVLPTFYDPSSRFILEAIAANKPVITTEFNGAADLFVDGLHGRIIDSPRNIAALAGAMIYFTDTKNIQEASEAIVSDNLKEKVSISRVAEQTESLYESILKEKSGK